jgi:hypothetical protein
MEKKRRTILLEIYKPKRKIKVSGEQAVPILAIVGGYFLFAGGLVSFAFSSIIFCVKSFFHIKEKVNRRILHKRYVELRIKKHK